MFNSSKFRRKFFAIFSLFSFVFNIFQPAFLALSLAPVISPTLTHAEDLPPVDASPEPTTSPSESIVSAAEVLTEEASPTPSSDIIVSPSPSIDPSPIASDTPTPAPTTVPTNPPAPADSSPAPPPSSDPTPTLHIESDSSREMPPDAQQSGRPTPSPFPDLNEQLAISILDNTAAESIEEFDLTVTETGSATLSTDKADYAPTDTALITGSGFLANTIYSLTISSSDDPATSTTASVTTDEMGGLFYAYQLDGIYRPNYKVEAFLDSQLVASTTFTDSDPIANVSNVTELNTALADPTVTTINLMGDISVGQQVNINRDITLNGNGFTVSSTFVYTNNSNNSVFGIHSSGVTLQNLIINGSGGTNLHGINIYMVTNILLDNVDVLNNDKAGIVVNGSIVTVNDILTAGNGWGGINVDQGSGVTTEAKLIIQGTSSHTDPLHIWLDDITKTVSVVDTHPSQYDYTESGNVGIYTLKTASNASVSLEQCRNGAAASPNDCLELGGGTGWVNGNAGTTQAHYVEGYSIPYRAILANLPIGTPITLELGYNIKHSDKNAIDYLTHYNRLAPHTPFGHAAETINPIDGVSGLSATIGTFAIPAPSSVGSPVTDQPTNSFNALPVSERLMTLFGGTITGIAYTSQGDLTSDNAETKIAVTFTVDSATAVLAWGGHIASRLDWGFDGLVPRSAGGINGSPYHMDVEGWNLGNLGSQDRSLSAGAVIPPGNLTIVKNVVPDNSSVWDFVTTGPNSYSHNTVDLPDNGQDILSVAPGTYTIIETTDPSYTTTVSCNTGETGTASVTVNVDSSESVVCTFVNTQNKAHLTLVKEITNDNGGTAAATDWTLSASGNTTISGTTGAPSITIAEVLAGTYTLSESAGPTGYTASAWSCVKNNNSPVTSSSITLAPNDNATCTITNNDNPPSLTLVKEVIKNNGGTAEATAWTLTASGPTGFSGAGPTVTNGVSFDAGTYDLSESGGPSGYSASAWVCVGGTHVDGDTVTLGLGQSATCTITNDDQPGSLIVNKVTIPVDDTVAFSITATGSGTIQGLATRNINSGTPVTYIVNSGNYWVSETPATGWSQTGNTCSNLSVSNGGSASCTITNTKLGSIAGTKFIDTNGNDVWDGEEPIGSGWLITLYQGATELDHTTTTSDGNYSFSGLLPNTYSIIETLLTGWTQTISPSPVVLGAGDVMIGRNFGNFQNVSVTACKVEDADGSASTTNDRTIVMGWGVNLTTDGQTTDTRTTGADGCYTWTNLGPAHTYGVTEESRTGWTPVGDTSHSFGLAQSGQTYTYTFANFENATIIVHKNVLGTDGTTNVSDDTAFKVKLNSANEQSISESLDVTNSNLTPGAYTVTESVIPGGYSLVSITGSPVNVQSGQTHHVYVTNRQVAAGLTVIKHVVNDNGGAKTAVDFTMNVTGNNVSDTSFSGAENPGTTVSLDAGTYSVAEGDHAGYTVEYSADCGGTIAFGESKTCTVTNNDIAPTLKLVKNVTTDNGGNETAASWTLSATGEAGFSDVGDSNTFHTVKAGVGYVLSESTIPGYTADAWSCDAGTLDGNTITLALDENVTCEITNNDIAPTLTVIKHVQNDNGGNATVADFDIELNTVNLTFGTGSTVGDITSYTSNPTVLANQNYTLSEIDFPGYDEGSWNCIDNNTQRTQSLPLRLAEGQNVTCEITNDDIAPTITLIKEVVNGTASVDSFGLSIGATSVTSGQTLTVDVNTPYVLNEVELTGYSFTSLTGTNCPTTLGGTVTLNEDEDITCTITNTRDLGAIRVHKIIDVDGDRTTTGDQTNGEGWEFTIDPEAADLSPQAVDTTDSNGLITFSNLKTGGIYEVIETEQGGYDMIFNSCASGVTVGKDQTTYCTIYNTPNGTIHGYKWEDQNGDGEVSEGESKLPGWTIELFRSNGDGGYESTPIKSMVTDSSEDHFGWYWFEHLFPGDYQVCEVLQPGWMQTYPLDPICHEISLPDTNPRFMSVSLNYIEEPTPEYNFGNQARPVLTIEKSNDAVGNKNPNDIVTFTLKLVLTGSSLTNVLVTDITPPGFTYVAGSWTSSKAGVGEPSYSSPAVWNVGNMDPGDIVTLTYQAKIAADQDGGTYNDIAWAQGTSQGWGTVLAQGVNSEYVDGNFVGTDVTIGENTQQTGAVNVEKTGEVLGASIELPATGINSLYLALALALAVIGLFFILGGKMLKKSLIIVLFLLFGHWSLAVTPVLADDSANNLSVRIEQPLSPTRLPDFRLGYTTLDRQARTPSVTCFVKKPGAASFVTFDVVHSATKPEGDHGFCQVNSSVMSAGDGTYEFKVNAVSGADSEDSSVVSVTYDTSAPGEPTSYSKDHPSICRWVIKFHTNSDNGATVKVEVYSSDQLSFNTDSGTRVGSVAIGSDQNGEFIHDRADNCDREWYYAIRAFDATGNQSAHRGDEVVNITVVNPTVTTSAIPVVAGSGSVLGQDQTDSDSGEVIGEETTAPEEIEGNGLLSGATEAVKDLASGASKWWVIAGIILLGGALYAARRKKIQSR